MCRFKSIFALLLFALAPSAWAAPCCGGASSLPELITGDDLTQVSASFSQGAVIGDAPAQGLPVFRGSGDSEATQVFRLSGAYLIHEPFQIGAELSIIRRVRSTGQDSVSSSGLGDVNADVAYEFLPERTYSAWIPKGFGFLQVTAPTGPSSYDATSAYKIDERGRGLWSVALGSAFVKTVGNFDFSSSFEFHRAFARTFQAQDGTRVTLSPGFGTSALLAGGYSPGGGATRLGLSISPVYEGVIRISDGVNEDVASSKLVWNTTLQLGYAAADTWSTNLSYTDQTLLGPARNVTLSRTVALNVQRRWPL